MTTKKVSAAPRSAAAVELAYLRGQSEAYREAMRQALYMYGMASLSGGLTPERLRSASKYLVDALLDKRMVAEKAIAGLATSRKGAIRP